jgi:4-hydroxy-4-methyl-2-oxoglutarate aldolase
MKNLKRILAGTLLLTLGASSGLVAQTSASLSDEQILKLYEGLRVADVSDGMDMAGLRDVGLMDQRIQALWKDTDNMIHQVVGIAVTARYVPTNKVVPNLQATADFQKWEGSWYNQISPETFVEQLKPGSMVVIDNQGDGDTGSVGSANSLIWAQKGARGIVSTGGIRDTDEIIKQKIPVYMDPLQRGRGIRPGRNELESVNKPVVVGGVLIHPGDVVVADGDGVIVVPRAYAEPVAESAHLILAKDKDARRNLYKALGIPEDKTVLPLDQEPDVIPAKRPSGKKSRKQ